MTPHTMDKTPTEQNAGRLVPVARDQFQLNRCYVELVIVPEPTGGFSAYVPSLPGVHSQGEHELEAFANIEEALRVTVESYRADGEVVPWLESYSEAPREHHSKWIELDA